MRLCTVLLVTLLWLAVTQAAAPTCALLDPEKHPRAAVLQAKVHADPSATWVERANIDKVLQEQKLQAMFSPQGVGERVKLGKLLKADVLVMVRVVKDAKEPTLEVVVSETTGGLRLLVRAVPITKNADADVAVLLTATQDGIKKHGEMVKEVVAVPPFVSQDLEITFDHLKAAYAKLTEGEALDRPGVVVVELAEAEAIARELTLGESKLDRALPVYLLGEYRHEGKGKDQTVRLKVRAERGGKLISKSESLTLKPDDAPEAIRKWAASVLDVLAKDEKPRPPADPKAEAKQLAARGLDFKRLGNWAEAVALFEAALLLDPDQLEIRVDILKTLGPAIRLAEQRMFRNDLPSTELSLRLYRRGLDHLDAFVTRGGDTTRYRNPVEGWDMVTAFRTEANYLRIPPQATPQQRELIVEAQAFERSVFLRLIPKVHHLDRRDYMPFVHGVLHTLPDADQLAMLDQFIRDLPDTPRSVVIAQWYGEAGVYARKGAGDAAFSAFREKLAAGQTAAYKAAAAEVPKWVKILEAKEKERLEFVAPVRAVTPNPDGVKLTDVELQLAGPTPKPFPVQLPVNRLMGLVKAGPSTDFIWSTTEFFLMKEKGVLRPVTGLTGKSGPGVHVRFDGKYVWVSNTLRNETRVLSVVDPVTERVWDITMAEGLPRPTADQLKARLLLHPYPLAPLGQGRVCLAGRIGDRTWIGVAEFDGGTGKATVKVVAEAREAEDTLNTQQWTSPELAFTPSYIHPVTEPGNDTVARVLVGRSRTGSAIAKANSQALMVDPNGVAKPEVIREPMGIYTKENSSFDLCGAAAGAMYFLESSFNPTSRLRRLQMPGPTVETIAEGIPKETRLILQEGDRWHMLAVYYLPPPKPGEPAPKKFTKFDTGARVWWTVEPNTKQPRVAGTDLPPIQSIAFSAHYGLVAIIVRDPDNQCVLQTVEIVPPKK